MQTLNVKKRCVVHIIKMYIDRCPEEVMAKGCYLKPLQKYENSVVWFSTVPLGNKLNGMVKSMMSEAGVKGYFTKHSLQVTAVSKLFQ